MRATWLLLAGLLTMGSVGCASSTTSTTSLRMGGGGPPDATVTIDERYLGSLGIVRKRGVALPPGRHRVSIERSGYFPYDKIIDVKEGDPPISLDVEMQRIPD